MNRIVEAQFQIEGAITLLRHGGQSREIAVALTHLETAQLWLLKEAKETQVPERTEAKPEIVIQDPCSLEPLASAPWYIRLAMGCL